MDKLIFNAMSILDQVEFINKEAETKSLTKLCKEAGINRPSVQRNFLKAGYVFNKEISQYDKDNTIVIKPHSSITKVPHKPPRLDIPPVENSITKEMQKYRDDLMELVNYKDDILELLKYHRNNTDVINISQLDMDELPKEYKGNIINKSIKVYAPVQKLFDDLCKSYGSHKKQDMISLALYQFCKMYKK